MKWGVGEYQWEGETRQYWKSKIAIGSLTVDRAEWLGDCNHPWGVWWMTPNDGEEVQLSEGKEPKWFATSDDAKAFALHWVKCIREGLGNDVVAGCGVVDDGE